jgi:FKBP-type peptidyl-prolyl cis-trans isomerase
MNNKTPLYASILIAILIVAAAVYIINNKKTPTMDTNGINTQTAPELEPLKPAEKGDLVVIHYTGTLSNGTKFDSSYDRGEPFVFIIGRDMVIKGWDEGLLGVQRGDKKNLVIPADKAYGDQEIKGPDGKVIIPKNSTLIFDLEVIEIVAKEKVDILIKEQEAMQAAQAASSAVQE